MYLHFEWRNGCAKTALCLERVEPQFQKEGCLEGGCQRMAEAKGKTQSRSRRVGIEGERVHGENLHPK